VIDTQLANYIFFELIHVSCCSPAARTQKLHIAYLLSWYNSIFDYKLKTIELKILKKLRTASLN